jgi:restriction system protein
MTIPDYQSLMLPLLRLASNGETSVMAAEATLASQLGLSEANRAELLPSGKQRVFHNRVHWAKFYLSKAGLLSSPKRGRFAITETGRSVLAENPDKIDNAFLLRFPSFVAFRSGEGSPVTSSIEPAASSTATPEELVETASKSLDLALRADLLDRVFQNSPRFFEQVIVDLLVAMGYGGSRKDAAERLGKSGDGGVDGVINEDLLGLDRIYVQAKRHAPTSSIGRPEIQAFTGSLVGLGASKGVFVSTSSFSAQAIDFAARVPQRIILIDGRRLTELMVSHNVGVRLSRIIEFKRLDEDYFTEED